MAETIEILVQDHKNLARLLKALERQVLLFEQTGDADFDIVRGVVDYCLSYPDLCHHPKEDVVMRSLLARDPRAASVIGDLEEEHRKLGEATRNFASALHQLVSAGVAHSNGGNGPGVWFGDTARSFLEAYWRHMDMEETLFFPIALKELSDADWEAVDREVERMVDPLFGGRAEERFKVLRNELLMWDDISP